MVKSISSRAKKKFQVPLTKASSFNFYQRICVFSFKNHYCTLFISKSFVLKIKKSFYLKPHIRR